MSSIIKIPYSIDIRAAQREAKKMPHCPLEVRATPTDNEMGAEYFAKNKDKLRADLVKYGAIWFRGFDLMKSVSGNREMHEALGLDPCLDPLHSSGLRKFASERDALYEEVSLVLMLRDTMRYILWISSERKTRISLQQNSLNLLCFFYPAKSLTPS